MTLKRIAIIGGGAAGFFAAITAAEADPTAVVTIHERGRHYLSKVKVSGGGRCNVTHGCFDPVELATHYPRGSRELRAAFHRWQPTDTIQWFAARGVSLKTEPDGRMFPTTDDSQTIIDCFMEAAQNAGVRLRREEALRGLTVEADGALRLELGDDEVQHADAVCVATGSMKDSPVARAVAALGHTIEPVAPSLFAFNIADKRTHGLAGLSVQNATVRILPNSASSGAGAPSGAGRKAIVPKSRSPQGSAAGAQSGALLITHRGLSGPAVLRLSAWQARRFQAERYHLDISINWLGHTSPVQLEERFDALRKAAGGAAVGSRAFEELPRRLWKRIVAAAGIDDGVKWGELTKKLQSALADQLLAAEFRVQGKTTNKEEFVTCGGVRLKEIDFRTMGSRLVPGLYFAGECLDIDGVTGGFNFQAAWTGGRIAGLAMADYCRG